MATRTNTNSKANSNVFGVAVDIPKAKRGRTADAGIAALMAQGLASTKANSFSVAVSNVTESPSGVKATVSLPNHGDVDVTYSKVKSWAQRSGRKLVGNGQGFGLSADSKRLTIALQPIAKS